MKKDVFKIEKEKTIPISELEIMFSFNKGTILFDEEITINVDGIYDNNRLRLIIHKEEDIVDIFTSGFRGIKGRCYRNFLLTEDEYYKYTNIQEFVTKVLIEGEHSDLGITMITLLDINNEYTDYDIDN